MSNWIEDKCKQFFDSQRKEWIWKEGLISVQAPGHTREMSQATSCRPGRDSAEYYAAGVSLGEVGDEEGRGILQALRQLQVTNPEASQYGAFRWYMEETQIYDSNAAFFILMPLAGLRLTREDLIPLGHIEFMDEMMKAALHWFEKECRQPILYYTNKIVSDGALLLAIASLTRSKKHYQLALQFFRQWEEYTDKRGWGWGENCSVVYLRVTLCALQTACLVLEKDEEESGMYARIRSRLKQLLDYTRFHGRHEFVPTIRSYNFEGETRYGDINWLLSGMIPCTEEHAVSIKSCRDINVLHLFGQQSSRAIEPSVPRTRMEPIFDGSCAYTWIGKRGRMGSINRFPVMPGCYQQDSWGLGWQSFPVSFCAENEKIAYLRWFVQQEGRVRTHPAASSHEGYLNNALFSGKYHPEVKTVSAQDANTLLVVRSISNLHHTAAEIADEWVMHQFGGEAELYDIEAHGKMRTWIVLKYATSCMAVTALVGITESNDCRMEIPVAIKREPNLLRIRQQLYAGEERIVSHPRLECGWGAVFIDQPMDRDALVRYLAQIHIHDETSFDMEIPRSEVMKKRKISLSIDGESRVDLMVDPLQS
jgi:hypothetical protein